MEWMILPLKRYFDFKGRSRRKEYWMYTLFVLLATIVLTILDEILGLGGSTTSRREVTDAGMAASVGVTGGLLANLFALATLIPSLAVSVRRLHDTNRSGWWIVLPMVPIFAGIFLAAAGLVTALNGSGDGAAGVTMIGFAMLGIGVICSLILLVWFCTAGTVGPNRFGEDPKGLQTNAEEVFG